MRIVSVGRVAHAARYLVVWAAVAGLGFGNTLCVADQREVPAKSEHPLPSDAPPQIINALMQRLYAIGETSDSVAEGTEAEKTAADGIRKYTASGSTDGLIAANAMGQTPLIAAAYNGYPQVVVALLESEVVRQRINDRDNSGGTAWLYANMALRQSAFACNPGILSNVFAWEPLMVTQFFYLHAPENPYRAIRTVLKARVPRGLLKMPRGSGSIGASAKMRGQRTGSSSRAMSWTPPLKLVSKRSHSSS
jgi:hypothetical protein